MKRLLIVFLVVVFGACTETKVVPGPTTTISGNDATTGAPVEIPAVPVAIKEIIKDTAAPMVSSVNPPNQTTGAESGTEISVAFSEAINPETIRADTFTLSTSSGEAVASEVQFDSNGGVAILNPAESLLDGESYTVSLNAGILDLAGNALLPFTSTFKVGHVKTDKLVAGQYYFLALKENGQVWSWGLNLSGQLGDGTLKNRNHPVRVLNLEDIDKISTGGSQMSAVSMALKKDGTVWAWGSNMFGQMGGETSLPVVTEPIQLTFLGNDNADIASNMHSLALKKDGTVWEWGLLPGENYQLAFDAKRQAPTPVAGLKNVKKIGVYASANYAIVQSDPQDPKTRSLWAWGSGSFGGLGNGVVYDSAVPVQVMTSDTGVPLTDVVDIAPGPVRLVLTGDGSLYTWGINDYSQLGNGTVGGTQATPIKIKDNIQTLGHGSSSNVSSVIDKDGKVWAWGDNGFNQLMVNTNGEPQTAPLLLDSLSGVVALANGFGNIGMIKEGGSVQITGGNLYGQLGSGLASFYSFSPQRLATLANAKFVGGRSVIDHQGRLWIWGRNVSCELGLSNAAAEVMIPTLIPLKDVNFVAREGMHVLAVAGSDRTLYAWGNNSYGQVGNGTSSAVPVCSPTPVKLPDGSVMKDVVYAHSGRELSVAIQELPDQTRKVWVWGRNHLGQLGQGTADNNPHAVPVEVALLPNNISKVSGESYHLIALAKDGTVYSWGDNTYGQLGDGTLNKRFIPGKITALSEVIDVAGGTGAASALKKDGTVLMWGRGNFGTMGNNTMILQNPTPLLVSNLNSIRGIYAEGLAMLALSQDGTLWTWGYNIYGQLGLGDAVTRLLPTRVYSADGNGLLGDIAEAATYVGNVSNGGGAFTVRKQDGSVYEWGFANMPPLFLVREGEAAFSATPLTVNWP